jgi:hypothetical protein
MAQPVRAPEPAIDNRMRRARLVAEYWHRSAMKAEWRTVAHVCSLILAAFDGETDPKALGIEPGASEFRDLERLRGH